MKTPALRTIGVWMILKYRGRLRGLMIDHNMTYRDLARIAGWGDKSQSYAWRVVNGKVRSVSADAANAIAAHFEVPVEDLFVTKVAKESGQIGKVAS